MEGDWCSYTVEKKVGVWVIDFEVFVGFCQECEKCGLRIKSMQELPKFSEETGKGKFDKII